MSLEVAIARHSFTACMFTFGVGMVEPSLLVDNSTVIAMAIEALLSSTAIAYRILLLSRERDAAREQEIAARLLADTDPLTGLLNRRAFLALMGAGSASVALAACGSNPAQAKAFPVTLSEEQWRKKLTPAQLAGPDAPTTRSGVPGSGLTSPDAPMTSIVHDDVPPD